MTAVVLIGLACTAAVLRICWLAASAADWLEDHTEPTVVCDINLYRNRVRR